MTDNKWVRLLAYVTGLVNQKLLDLAARMDRSFGHALTRHENLSDRERFNGYFIGGDKRPFVTPVHPRTHNERMAAQQGTFLCYSNLKNSLMENVHTYLPPNQLLEARVFHKLVISSAAAIGILSRLSSMNIHSASLFPDIDGFVDYVEDNLLLFATDADQVESHLDFESLERLGWSG